MSADLSPAELQAIRNNIDDHDDLQQFLKAGFSANGWDVRTEVTPDNSNLRVDMLLRRGGCRIGVELKYLYPGDGLTKVGHAVRKIKQQYATKSYSYRPVNLWAVGIYGRHFVRDTTTDQRFSDGKREATQNILNALNIGYVRTTSSVIGIEFSPGDTALKVPGFSASEHVDDRSVDTQPQLDVIQQKAGVTP